MQLTGLGIILSSIGAGSGLTASFLASRWHIIETYKIISGKRQEDEMLLKEQQIKDGAALRGTSGYITATNGIAGSEQLSTGLVLSTALETTETNYNTPTGEEDATDILDQTQVAMIEKRKARYMKEEVYNQTGVLNTEGPIQRPTPQPQEYKQEQVLDAYTSTSVEAQQVQQGLKPQTIATFYSDTPLNTPNKHNPYVQPGQSQQPGQPLGQKRPQELKVQTEVIIQEPQRQMESITVGDTVTKQSQPNTNVQPTGVQAASDRYVLPPLKEQQLVVKANNTQQSQTKPQVSEVQAINKPGRYTLPTTSNLTKASKTLALKEPTQVVEKVQVLRPERNNNANKTSTRTEKQGKPQIIRHKRVQQNLVQSSKPTVQRISRPVKPHVNKSTRVFREVDAKGRIREVKQADSNKGYDVSSVNAPLLAELQGAYIASEIDLTEDSVLQSTSELLQKFTQQPFKQDTQVLNAPPEEAFDATQVLVTTEELSTQPEQPIVVTNEPITAQLDGYIVEILKIERGGSFTNA